MTTKLLANQLRGILNDPVEGFTVELADESNLYEWRIWVEGSKDTCYQGGVFQLSLNFPKDYPMSPPTLKFVSDFWHPNVFPDGKVCMSILHPPGEDAMSGEMAEERWLPTQSVTTIILSLMSVLNDPNCSSPANVDASVEWRKHRDAYKNRCVKLVEKANRERPAHIVIPHPESDADQHRRRVQKFHEMNKDLDYDDFYAEDGAEEEEEEDADENEFLESENEIYTEDESARSTPAVSPQPFKAKVKAPTAKIAESAEISESGEISEKTAAVVIEASKEAKEVMVVVAEVKVEDEQVEKKKEDKGKAKADDEEWAAGASTPIATPSTPALSTTPTLAEPTPALSTTPTPAEPTLTEPSPADPPPGEPSAAPTPAPPTSDPKPPAEQKPTEPSPDSNNIKNNNNNNNNNADIISNNNSNDAPSSSSSSSSSSQQTGEAASGKKGKKKSKAGKKKKDGKCVVM